MLGITIKTEWETEPVEGDGSICQECDEQITGLMFQGYLFVYDNDGQIPTDYVPSAMKVCEQCRYKMMNEPETET